MLKEKNNKAVIYCRVSTKEQVEEGNSLVTQERNCREYALKHNYDVVGVFIEQGESAKTVDRTELQKLFAFVAKKKHQVSAVIAYKIDRISRNTDDYSQIRILFKRYGVEIKSTSEHFEDTPAGRFMENIIANVAQFDNDVRAERSTGGMKDAVREGRYVWQAPYGYSNVRVDGKATIAPNGSAIFIGKAFEAMALSQGHVEEVRVKLIAEGLTVKNGKPLSKSYFYRIIKNELYTGWITMFGERHKGTFDPIISEELFNEVQRILDQRNKHVQPRLSDNPDFPLRRFIRHPSGRLLTGAWSAGHQKKYPYYILRNDNINIRKEVLESAFIGWVNLFKIDIKHFEKLHAYLKTDLEKKFIENAVKKERLENKVIELKNKQNAIVNKNIGGVISDELCQENLADIQHELYFIHQNLLQLPEIGINQKELLQVVREVLLRPGDLWEKADLQSKIKLQWLFFPEGIEIDKNGSRTTKICKLFKLKELFSPYQSSKVNHPISKSNRDILQLSLPPPNNLYIQSPEFWEELREEVQIMKEILHPEKHCLIDKLPSLIRHRH